MADGLINKTEKLKNVHTEPKIVQAYHKKIRKTSNKSGRFEESEYGGTHKGKLH